MYYHTTSARGREAAEIIASNFRDIYPNPEKVRTVPNSSFAELRRVNAPSVLVEIAYHDNPTDAEWIKNNIDLIGRTLAPRWRNSSACRLSSRPACGRAWSPPAAEG